MKQKTDMTNDFLIELDIMASSALKRMTYDRGINVLYVQFKNEDVWQYENVSFDIVRNLENQTNIPNGSVGSYFHHTIKTNIKEHPGTKVPEMPTTEHFGFGNTCPLLGVTNNEATNV